MGIMNVTDFTRKNGIFDKFDKNKDGKLSRYELATATACEHWNNHLDEASILGTMVFGGSDNKGLMFDKDGDHCLSKEELQQFAGQSGDSNEIDTADFKSAFSNASNIFSETTDSDYLSSLEATVKVKNTLTRQIMLKAQSYLYYSKSAPERGMTAFYDADHPFGGSRYAELPYDDDW